MSCIFLYIIKVFVNEKFKDKIPAPIPVELLLVVIGTAISHFCKFNQRFKVKTIGYLPLGYVLIDDFKSNEFNTVSNFSFSRIPKPFMPPLSIFPLIFGDAAAIAIVSFALNVSMAKLYAKKHRYHIHPNQELFAYGVGNMVASFFSGFPSCVGLSRTVIIDSVGGRTQVT